MKLDPKIQAIIAETALYLAHHDYRFIPEDAVSFVMAVTDSHYQLVKDTIIFNQPKIERLRDELRAFAFDQTLKRPY